MDPEPETVEWVLADMANVIRAGRRQPLRRITLDVELVEQWRDILEREAI